MLAISKLITNEATDSINRLIYKNIQTCKPGSVPQLLRASIIYLPGLSLTRSSSLPLTTSEESKRAVLYPPEDSGENHDIFGFATHQKYG